MGNEPRGRVAFDTGGHLARVRRLADLSQRELAEVVGVGQASIARWESGGTSITVAMLARVLGLAGLRLEVVDDSGAAVHPVPADSVRDNAGRRFPAHLDVARPGDRPANRGAGPRYDRAEAKGWYSLRSTRDQSVAAGSERPSDHPTVSSLAEHAQVAAAHRADRRARAAARRGGSATALGQVPECTCPDACFERPACLEACGRRCETPIDAAASGWWTSRPTERTAVPDWRPTTASPDHQPADRRPRPPNPKVT